MVTLVFHPKDNGLVNPKLQAGINFVKGHRSHENSPSIQTIFLPGPTGKPENGHDRSFPSTFYSRAFPRSRPQRGQTYVLGKPGL